MHIRLNRTTYGNQTRSTERAQLDEGMVDTLVSVKMARRIAKSGEISTVNLVTNLGLSRFVDLARNLVTQFEGSGAEKGSIVSSSRPSRLPRTAQTLEI
jgi:hypothetical protein